MNQKKKWQKPKQQCLLDTSKFVVDKEIFTKSFNMKRETKYKSSLKLAAIGDALGWMTEFEKVKKH